MSTSSSMNIRNLSGLQDSKSSLGKYWKNHEPSQSTSSSEASGDSNSHKRSDSRATIATASSSLSGDAELSHKRSNLSDSIDEEDVGSQHEDQTPSVNKPQHFSPNKHSKQQSPSKFRHPQPASDDDNDDGIFQQMFNGMSDLVTATSAEIGETLAGIGDSLAAGVGESAHQSSQPSTPQRIGEEKKSGEEEEKVRKSEEPSTKLEDARQKLRQQEEDARQRFDRLRDLIMMGDDDDDDDENKDDIFPPNPQPLQEKQQPRKRPSLFTPEKKKPKERKPGGGCDRRVKVLMCALVVVLLCALIVPVYISVSANQKSAAALAATSPTAMPSAMPTVSMSPSTSPTVSQMPSVRPTNHPTMIPTMSSRPTISPSLRPTASNRPSQVPSISQIPSILPSGGPSASKEPSEVPSYMPSQQPSVSIMPSYSTISPDYAFKVRLQWQQSYFWQEEKVERWWCLECVRCNSYGGGDGWEHGCRSYGTGNEAVCQAGDSIWIRDCRERANRFNVLENRESGFMLRIATTNLCVTRERRRWLKVDHCDRNREDQQFVPWQDYNKFELRPLVERDLGEREATCVSQLHHPKQDELVSLHNCRLCRIYETRYWQVYLGEDDYW